ncbi:MAG: phosphoribosylanthranilate isomerase [Lachnospiraceae bacterium]|nr:phosphoribosylanthranilate isomerase [Lachnospiraceae bacterium]
MNGTKIKICGLYREEDIEYINRYRPDYAGFVFYPKSHRNVEKKKMRYFREKLSREIAAVGVFVNEDIEVIKALAEEGDLDIIQLHGEEDEAYLQRLRRQLPKTEIWRAYKVWSKEDLVRAEGSSADKILLDHGYGTGKCFDWTFLKNQKRPFILAGGLCAENVREAIDRFSPEIVDISSGVETDGKKDREKIKTVIKAVRQR